MSGAEARNPTAVQMGEDTGEQKVTSRRVILSRPMDPGLSGLPENRGVLSLPPN
jgi:hypothetical protein